MTIEERSVMTQLRDALTMQRQGWPITNTPEHPFGQMTGVLPDGTEVDRHAYATEALKRANELLNRRDLA